MIVMKKKAPRLARPHLKFDGTSRQHAIRGEDAQAARAVRNQKSVRRLRGRVAWEGNLQESRLGRVTK